MTSIFDFLKILKSLTFFSEGGECKKYPKVIQLPITYKCNSKCVMCNIWNMDSSNEVSLEEFSKFMKDPIFKKVESVGINGGEPTLVENLPDYAKEILKLPNIKFLNIISNGYYKNKLLYDIREIYSSCKKKQVKFHVSISLDGVGKIHDRVRGKIGAFEKTINTLKEIERNKEYYCDSFDIGCTVVRQNVNYLKELDSFIDSHNLTIKYRLGISNSRIQSTELLNNFSVLGNKNEQAAKEFFYCQMNKAKKLGDKFKYYAIFEWLNAKKPKRMLGCAWKQEGVTLDSRGNLYYCAVASKCIGCLINEKGENIFFSRENIKYRSEIVKSQCDQCIHDYGGKIEITSLIKFLIMLAKRKFSMKIYKVILWLYKS